MVNNSAKSKVFCQNDLHVGAKPQAEIPMLAYEPKHDSVQCLKSRNKNQCGKNNSEAIFTDASFGFNRKGNKVAGNICFEVRITRNKTK